MNSEILQTKRKVINYVIKQLNIKISSDACFFA